MFEYIFFSFPASYLKTTLLSEEQQEGSACHGQLSWRANPFLIFAFRNAQAHYFSLSFGLGSGSRRRVYTHTHRAVQPVDGPKCA